MDNDDNIRPPDESITERLIDSDFVYSESIYSQSIYDQSIYQQSISEEKLKEILELSENEFLENQNKIIEETRQKELESRIQMCSPIKKKINRLLLLDINNASIYNDILTIIIMFEQGDLCTYKLDAESYERIFKIIHQIRMNKEEIELIHKIILKE